MAKIGSYKVKINFDEKNDKQYCFETSKQSESFCKNIQKDLQNELIVSISRKKKTA